MKKLWLIFFFIPILFVKAQSFKPEDIIGRQVVVVANLAPRKMKGIESNGMILMAEDPAGRLIFVAPDEKISTGSEVR